MERSSLCPTCRCPVERICKNHILNNLVEAYLIQHPESAVTEGIPKLGKSLMKYQSKVSLCEPGITFVFSTAPQEYCCPPQGCHLICTCCLQPMPDRRAELNNQQQVIAQQCELFSHLFVPLCT
ncbi:hypothetical protein GOODEAATRI_014096 [Goodea atripinnis]|uniref:E3 ubiquitin-protein ligase CHFR cysteine rich domain-containing protein n=1 Tax=Goodea atripinnis TaxID=208336 RepID=A0ABV0PXZ2_9TELE